MPSLGGWNHWDQAGTAGSDQNCDLGSKIHTGQALHSAVKAFSSISSVLLKQAARNVSPPLKPFQRFY